MRRYAFIDLKPDEIGYMVDKLDSSISLIREMCETKNFDGSLDLDSNLEDILRTWDIVEPSLHWSFFPKAAQETLKEQMDRVKELIEDIDNFFNGSIMNREISDYSALEMCMMNMHSALLR